MQTVGQTNHLVSSSLLGRQPMAQVGWVDRVKFLETSIIPRAGSIVCRVGENSSKKMGSKHIVIFKVDIPTVEHQELCLMLWDSLVGRGLGEM